MVDKLNPAQSSWYYFQYSLCRVVLMVREVNLNLSSRHRLSVLALSSRFDGRISRDSLAGGRLGFQYSLCRVVLMVNPSGMGRYP